MKIVVCIKQIIQTYAQTGMDFKTRYLSAEDQILRINPYDEAALEIALQIKDENKGVEIILLTLGPVKMEKELRRCMALGADHLYHIDTNEPQNPWKKSEILARALKSIAPDLILCGRESMDRQNGQVGAFVAHFLNHPFVSNITELTLFNEDKKVKVKRSCGRGVREILQSSLPAVFSVDMGGRPIRMPKLKDQEIADARPFHKVLVPFEENSEETAGNSCFPPCPRTKEIAAPDSHLDSLERISELLTGSRMQKKARMLDGNPESQVGGIIEFLKENDFLNP